MSIPLLYTPTWENTHLATPRNVNILAELVGDLTFLPSPEQRKAKSAYWTVRADSPLQADRITLQEAQSATGEGRLRKWWTLPGFPEWFANREEFRQRVEYLANLALDTAEEILLDRNVNANARVQMAKLVIEAANRMPQKYQKELYVDEKVAQMGKKELEEYIRKASILLAPLPEPVSPPAAPVTEEPPQ